MGRLEASLLRSMDEAELWPAAGSPVLVAVSGGLDSSCLARLLAGPARERGLPLILAHANHGLRPQAAAADRAAVEGLAAELGLALRCTDLEISEPLLAEVGLEAAARQARLAWLEQLAASEGSSHVFLGHHLDDQLETILLRRSEGLPPREAGGMAARRGIFCRPLLEVSRAQLHALACEAGWSWSEDSSNQDVRFARNALRHEVIPALRAADATWEAGILAEGAAARARRAVLRADVERDFGDLLRAGPRSQHRLVRERLAASDEVKLVHLFQRLCVPELRGGRGPSRRSLQSLAAGVLGDPETRLYSLGAEWTARVDRDVVLLQRGDSLVLEDDELVRELALPLGRTASWDPSVELGAGALSAERARDYLANEPGAGLRFAVFDASRLQLPLQITSSSSGRSMPPFGMEGSRAVRDLLSEAGVPRPERAGWPLVCDAAGTPLWLPGVRASNNAALLARSERAVMLYTVAAFGYDPTANEMS